MLDCVDTHRDRCPGASCNFLAERADETSFVPDAIEDFSPGCNGQQLLIDHLIQSRLDGQYCESGGCLDAIFKSSDILLQPDDALAVTEHFESPFVSVSRTITIGGTAQELQPAGPAALRLGDRP